MGYSIEGKNTVSSARQMALPYAYDGAVVVTVFPVSPPRTTRQDTIASYRQTLQRAYDSRNSLLFASDCQLRPGRVSNWTKFDPLGLSGSKPEQEEEKVDKVPDVEVDRSRSEDQRTFKTIEVTVAESARHLRGNHRRTDKEWTNTITKNKDGTYTYSNPVAYTDKVVDMLVAAGLDGHQAAPSALDTVDGVKSDSTTLAMMHSHGNNNEASVYQNTQFSSFDGPPGERKSRQWTPFSIHDILNGPEGIVSIVVKPNGNLSSYKPPNKSDMPKGYNGSATHNMGVGKLTADGLHQAAKNYTGGDAWRLNEGTYINNYTNILN